MTLLRFAVLGTLCLCFAACSGGEPDASDHGHDHEPPAADPEPAAEAPAEAAAEPEAAEPEAAEPAAQTQTLTLMDLRTDWDSKKAELIGTSVQVTAQFLTATSVSGKVNTISLIINAEDYDADMMKHSVGCAFGDSGPESVSHVQYTDVTVTGTVAERFGRAALDDCVVLTE